MRRAPRPPSPWGCRLLAALRAQRTGVLCAFASAALLGAGSFVMDVFPRRYRGLAFGDLRFFFDPPALIHGWLYLLMACLTVWALSTLVCTWDSLLARVRRGVRRPSAYGAPIVHLSFVLALLAHLWGGLAAQPPRQHIVGSSPVQIGDATYSALAIEQVLYPSGMPRVGRVTLERVSEIGRTQVVVGYNEPLLLDAGATELLMSGYAWLPTATLRYRGRRVELHVGESLHVGDDLLRLQRIFPARGSLRSPVAQVVIFGPGSKVLAVAHEVADGSRLLRLDLNPTPGADLVFVASGEEPVVSLSERHNPSVPLVMAVAGLIVIGILLVAWERTGAISRRPG